MKGLRPATLLKNSLWHRCFPVNFAKLLKTPFFIENFRWLLLEFTYKINPEERKTDFLNAKQILGKNLSDMSST